MYSEKNIIKKLQVEVNTNSVTKAMQIKDDIDSFIKNEIYPEIEKILKKYSQEIKQHSIQIDNVFIDINESSYSGIKSTIKDKLEKSIKSATTTKKRSSKNTLSKEEKTINAFMCFLKNGELPWWFNKQDFIKKNIIKAIRNNTKKHKEIILLFRSKKVRKRIVYQLDFFEIEALIFELSNADFETEYSHYKKLINKIPNHKTKDFWTVVLSENFSPNSNEFTEVIYKELALLLNIKNFKHKKENTNDLIGPKTDDVKEKNIEFRDSSEDEHFDDIQDTNEILVQNAGLIILHPFLIQFFTKLGFYEKGEKTLKKEKIHEATHLLHFLATKNETPYEYELSFEKFLCGIQFYEPIKRLNKISLAQKKECDDLLESVTNHWNALKTSNTDTLRSGFLMREGKLIKGIESNKLLIQRQAHDILLERIPWGLSMLKLPWINSITFIEW